MDSIIARRDFLKYSLAGGVMAVPAVRARAQGNAPFRIGVMNDQSSVYSNLGGKGSRVAIELAIEDFGGSVLGRPIELLSADHQNKVDVGTSIAREWLDVKGVQAIFDLQTSSVALAVIPILAKANKIGVASASSSSDITGKACTPVTFHWTYDSYALSRVQPTALVKQGKLKWFLINIDNAAGTALEADLTNALTKLGATILGKVKAPLGATDYTSVLLMAQNSGADVIQIGASGADLVNEINQIKEFGIDHGKIVATTGMSIIDVNSLGLEKSEGLLVAESFYWDLNEATRNWSKRYIERMGVPATMYQAGNYSAALHYLKAVDKVGSSDGLPVANMMKRTPVEDMMSNKLEIREDGRVVREVYLFRVKAPKESKHKFDYYHVDAVVPGASLVRPLSESECQFIKK